MKIKTKLGQKLIKGLKEASKHSKGKKVLRETKGSIVLPTTPNPIEWVIPGTGKVNFYPKTKSLYIKFLEEEVESTSLLDFNVAVDYNKDGRVIGLEILSN